MGGSVCGTESCSTGLSGSTPAAGVETLLQKLIVSFPGLCVQLRGAATGLQGGTRPGWLPISQTGAKSGACSQEDPGPQDRLPSPLALAQGMGALGRSRDKLGQGVSHRPASYLGRCQQTGPHAGVPGRGARGRQGGAHVCANTHTWVWVSQGVMTTQSDTQISCRSLGGGQAAEAGAF